MARYQMVTGPPSPVQPSALLAHHRRPVRDTHIHLEVTADAARCYGVCRGVTASRASTSGSAEARRIMARAATQEIVCWGV